MVAARLRAPDRAEALLHHLRVRVMQAGLLDDPALIAAAAVDAGLDPAAIVLWCATEEVGVAVGIDADDLLEAYCHRITWG